MEQMFVIMAGFAGALLSLFFGFKYILNRHSKKLISQNAAHDGLTKKHNLVDVNQYSGLLFNLGAILALGICYFVFELKQYEDVKLMDLGKAENEIENVIDIPNTIMQPPPPPKTLMQPDIKEVNDEAIIDKIDVNMTAEAEEEAVIDVPIQPIKVEEEPKEDIEVIFDIVEEPTKPVGDYPAFYNYVRKSLTYPSQAKRMGVEGKVYVQFVVDKDGSLTEVKVMKGIGAGCDEEAARVIKEAPKWMAGKQRGKPVKQRIVMPITFKLAN